MDKFSKPLKIIAKMLLMIVTIFTGIFIGIFIYLLFNYPLWSFVFLIIGCLINWMIVLSIKNWIFGIFKKSYEKIQDTTNAIKRSIIDKNVPKELREEHFYYCPICGTKTKIKKYLYYYKNNNISVYRKEIVCCGSNLFKTKCHIKVIFDENDKIHKISTDSYNFQWFCSEIKNIYQNYYHKEMSVYKNSPMQ
jgi:hypothetical protein